MDENGFWSRLKKARLFRVLAIYAGASWVVLQLVGLFISTTELPEWTFPGAVVLLLIGFIVILATAWVQAHPLIDTREQAEAVPGTWDMALRDLTESVRSGQLPHLTWARTIAAGAIVFLLFFGFAGLYVVVQDRGRSFVPTEASAAVAKPGLAVLPFSVRGAELQEWREGMVDLLSMDLDGAAGVRAVDSRTVLARWEELVGESTADRETSLAVARAANARWALLGTAVGIGSNVRLVADVHAVEDGRKLGQVQVEGTPEEMHRLVDDLAIEVLDLLVEGDVTELPRVDLASVTTRSVPALKAFLEGEEHLRHGEFPAAIEAYDRAVREDSLFAYAYLRLAEAHGWNEGAPGAARYRDRAVELADRLPERQRFLARTEHRLRDEGDPAAVDSLIEATRRYPDDPGAWYLLGEAYFHYNDIADPPAPVEEAIRPFRRAVELDPGFGPYRIHPVELLLLEPEVDSVRLTRALDSLVAVSSGGRLVRSSVLAVELAVGDSAARGEAWAAADTASMELLSALGQRLRNPSLARDQERVYRTLLDRAPPEGSPGARSALAQNLALRQGEVRAGLAVLEGQDAGNGPPATCLLALIEMRGVHLSEELIQRSTPGTGDGEPPPGDVAICTALVWIARDDAARADAAIETVRRANEASPAPDSVRREMSEGMSRLFRALRTWKDGRPAEAIGPLEEIREEGRLRFPLSFYGDLYREAGRRETALAFYLGDWADPLSHREAGLILADLGRPEEARVHLQAFLAAWRDADPELQPLVEEARAALEEL